MRRRPAPRVSGVALVDKPAGCTSHDVVQTLRRGIGQAQVGHTGTLDPAATGLMVVTLGRATRIGRFLEAEDKTYEGTVRLGTHTSTWDAEGEVLTAAEVEPPTTAAVTAVLAGLVGELEQEVPAFSAVKVDGERLHAKARRGEAVQAPKRVIHVRGLRLLGLAGLDVRIEASVSKGTYIRSLAVEIGRRLGVPAHLASLRRTRVGPHPVEAAAPPARFAEPAPPVISPSEALEHLPRVELDAGEALSVSHGRRLRRGLPYDGPVRLVTSKGDLIAVGRRGERGPPAVEYDVVLMRPEELLGRSDEERGTI